ncbi:MAG: glycosyltransferase [Dechloromonas sp.]|nr:glycosyltransferase [Dechloromonas sp.]
MADPDKSTAVRHRLLVLASTYPRWSGDHEPGFVHELNRRLVDHFEVHVICPHAPGAARQEVLDGVTVHRFRYGPNAMETLVQDGGVLANLKRSFWKWCVVPFFVLGLLAATSKHVKQIRPHCIHAHWIVPQGLSLALLGVLPRNLQPFLLTSHGGDLFSLRGRLFRELKRWVLRKASAVTVVSRPMLTEAVKLGANVDRTSVIPMGVDFDGRFSLDPGAERVAGQILFVGRLVEKKGVKYLIQALPSIRQRVPSAHLVIVGSGPELPALTALVSRLRLQDCIEFRGAMSQDALPEFYRRAAVFVAPFVDAASGDREGLGLVSIEAIACGCPVVVGDVPVVADIFLDTEMDMRAIPGNPESLAQKVGDVLVAPEEALRRALDVRQRLARQLSWDIVTKRYSALLKNVAGTS